MLVWDAEADEVWIDVLLLLPQSQLYREMWRVLFCNYSRLLADQCLEITAGATQLYVIYRCGVSG